jgi:hypothetical protein
VSNNLAKIDIRDKILEAKLGIAITAENVMRWGFCGD